MQFETMGDKNNPAVLFFHAMGVTGKSSERVAEFLKNDYFCIMPTSTVYCQGQKYISKEDEIRQIDRFLKEQNVSKIALVVASSIGADLAVAFLNQTKTEVDHVFFDGGQFAKIKRSTRKFMTPFLYFAIKSVYWSKGKTLGKIMWCSDDDIKPYFAEAGKNLRYRNLLRQMGDSLQNEPFLALSEELQKQTYFEFGNKEEHFKYRNDVMASYPQANFPIFEGHNHMQYQIKDPQGFASMLKNIVQTDSLPDLPFLKQNDGKALL